MVDNTPPTNASEGTVAGFPKSARRLPGPFRVCPNCGRAYWQGSHARPILAQLERWRAVATDPS
jgi:uncharacterized protein with PIN domain